MALVSGSLSVFAGCSEAFGATMRSFDWRASAAGSPETWPVEVRSIVRLMLRSNFATMVAWGPDLGVVYNQAYACLLGDKHPASLGAPLRLIWAELADYVEEVVVAAYQGIATHEAELELTIMRDGRPLELVLSFSFMPLVDEQGDVIGVSCTLVDRTAEINAREALRQERDQSRNILESMGESCVLLDADYRIVQINAEGLRLDGRSKVKLIGKWFGEAWPDLLDTRLHEALKVSMRDRTPGLEDIVFNQDLWLEARIYPVADGLGVFMRDVTSEKALMRGMSEARESADKVHAERAAILNQLLEGVVVANQDGVITFANEAAKRIAGIDFVGLSPANYAAQGRLVKQSGEPWAVEELPFSRAILNGETTIGEVVFVDMGEPTPNVISTSAKPLTDEAGVQVGAVLTIRDDTARTRAEEALRAVNETLEERVEARTMQLEIAQDALRQAQKMEAVGRLTGGIAHDFNNSLSVVIGSLDLLRSRLDQEDHRAAKLVDSARRSAKKAAGLTARLLAFARQQPLLPQSVDPNGLVTGMTMLIAKSLGEDVNVCTDCDAQAWAIMVDPNQLENAILNLAVNANDAMPNGGRLLIETRNVRLDLPKEMPDAVRGEFVLISVTDSGVGMDEETIGKAFDPFFTTKEVGKGTGLGLSQVHGFIHQSGGLVRITSQVGVGTKIKMYLPRSFVAPEVAVMAPETYGPVTPAKREWILLVEDEPDVREMTDTLLQDAGYRTVVASSGREALRLLTRNPQIDLLLTDISMPTMSGWRLAEEVKRRRPGLKVLFTSGYAPDRDMKGEGVVVVDKPFEPVDLELKIREVLEKQ